MVFIAFAFFDFGQKPQWKQVAAFLYILGAVASTFLPGEVNCAPGNKSDIGPAAEGI